MENGIWNLATEEVVKETLITEEKPIVEEKDLNEEELVDPITKSEEDKTLGETLYEESIKEDLEKTKEEIKEQADEFDLPEPTLAEKEEAIEDIVDELKSETKWDKDLTEETLEKLATMFYEKEENYQKEIKLLTIKNSKLEKSYEEALEQINDMKYDKNRISVDDEDLWYFVNLRKKFTKNPSDKNIQKEIAKYHMLWLKELYPEFDPVETSKIINERRLKAIEAVTSKNESSGWIVNTPSEWTKRPKWFALNM